MRESSDVPDLISSSKPQHQIILHDFGDFTKLDFDILLDVWNKAETAILSDESSS